MVLQQWQVEGLSKRAVEILQLLADGMSDREIAERLILTINTVKWYNRQIYQALNVSSRTQAVILARKLQLIQENSVQEPLRTNLNWKTAYDLPAEQTAFIGRKHEIASTRRLMETARLLTLVGAPGAGKTRLAMQVAREMKDSFPNGIYFVSLASLSDPSRILNAIATSIGINKIPGQPLIDTLKLALGDSHLLLILDNVEHLLSGISQIAALQAGASHLKVLATSREPLRLYGEQEYAIPPLSLPDEACDLPALLQCESVALFVEQAQRVNPCFELTPENAADVRNICLCLEGLPLAIELAAARSKLLTPQILLERLLSSRLNTLARSAYNLPARHQTLRNALQWSYRLLNASERILFTRLAAVPGQTSVETMEAVCGDGLSMDVVDGLESLVNKNLVQQYILPGGQLRFSLSPMIHEFAQEKLRGEIHATEKTYIAHFRPSAKYDQLKPYWAIR